MNVFLDIETIPGQSCFDEYLQGAKENFKAPSSLTKTQACADLGLTGDDAKYTSKDDAIAKWTKKFAEEKAPEVAEENWRKTSFDGGKGELASVVCNVNGSWFIKIREKDECEKTLLQMFIDWLDEKLESKQEYFIGHNIPFDLKFLFRRCKVLGVDTKLISFPFRGYHGKDYFCTMQAWCERGERISQDDLCKALGIEQKPSDINGSNVWDHYKSGNYAKILEYNEYDVDTVKKLHNRLK